VCKALGERRWREEARMKMVELVGGGACSIVSGRRWGGGEVAGGGGVLIPISFKVVKGGEETRRRRLDGELEGDDPTLRFGFTQVREGGRHRHMARRHGLKGGGVAGNGQRWETSGEIGLSGLRMPVGQLGQKAGRILGREEEYKKRFSDFDSRNEIQI
jgi:hypothetical protein